MKFLLGVIVLGALGYGIYVKYPSQATPKQSTGVRIGATVEEVEKVLGRPSRVLPQFGRQSRFYKGESGKTYMLVFEGGELVEIH